MRKQLKSYQMVLSINKRYSTHLITKVNELFMYHGLSACFNLESKDDTLKLELASLSVVDEFFLEKAAELIDCSYEMLVSSPKLGSQSKFLASSANRLKNIIKTLPSHLVQHGNLSIEISSNKGKSSWIANCLDVIPAGACVANVLADDLDNYRYKSTISNIFSRKNQPTLLLVEEAKSRRGKPIIYTLNVPKDDQAYFM